MVLMNQQTSLGGTNSVAPRGPVAEPTEPTSAASAASAARRAWWPAGGFQVLHGNGRMRYITYIVCI